MSKKASKKKVQAKPAVSKFAAPVVDSAREIWLAGLGAVYVAQNESGKLFEQGNKLFDKLVSEGAKLEKKSRNEVETAVDDFVGGMESKVDAFRQQATENWDSLANVFDERVSGTLDRLGVPTTKDLDKLSGNVKKVSRQAAKNWKDLESAFEQRVSGVLDNLHIPGAKDLNKLSDSVQKVSVDATENLGKLSDNVQKASREAVENLQKFENVFEARVTEILGGMGLILSLIFVGIQIRESNRATMSAMASASVDSISTWYVEIGNDDQSSALLYQYFANPSSLSPEKKFQAAMNLHGLFLIFQNTYYLANEGTLEEQILHSLTEAIFAVKAQPGLLLFWKQRKYIFLKGFQEYVESILTSDRSVSEGLFSDANLVPPSNKAANPPTTQSGTH